MYEIYGFEILLWRWKRYLVLAIFVTAMYEIEKCRCDEMNECCFNYCLR